MRRDIYYILVIVAAVIIIFLQSTCNAKRIGELKLQNQLNEDTAKIFRDKYNQSNATIATIVSDYSTLKELDLSRTDSITKLLVKLVNKRTVNAAVVEQEVSFDTVLKTDTVYYTNGDSCNPVYVVHDTSYTDKDSSIYRTVDIKASKDSFDMSVKEFETLTFKTEWSKWTPFKKRSCISSYQNTNPDVTIIGMRTFTVQCDCKKNFWLGVGVGGLGGLVLGFGGGYLYGRTR